MTRSALCTVCIVWVRMHTHSVGAALRCKLHKMAHRPLNTGMKNMLPLPTQRHINKFNFLSCATIKVLIFMMSQSCKGSNIESMTSRYKQP